MKIARVVITIILLTLLIMLLGTILAPKQTAKEIQNGRERFSANIRTVGESSP